MLHPVYQTHQEKLLGLSEVVQKLVSVQCTLNRGIVLEDAICLFCFTGLSLWIKSHLFWFLVCFSRELAKLSTILKKMASLKTALMIQRTSCLLPVSCATSERPIAAAFQVELKCSQTTTNTSLFEGITIQVIRDALAKGVDIIMHGINLSQIHLGDHKTITLSPTELKPLFHGQSSEFGTSAQNNFLYEFYWQCIFFNNYQ